MEGHVVFDLTEVKLTFSLIFHHFRKNIHVVEKRTSALSGRGWALGKSYANAFIQVLLSIKEVAEDSLKKGEAAHTWVEQVLRGQCQLHSCDITL